MSSLEERIRELVKRAGNMTKLAKAADMTPSHISGILRRLAAKPNAQLEADTLVKLAKGGGVTVEWLLGVTDESEPPNVVSLAGRQKMPRPDIEYNDRYNTRAVVVRSYRGVYDDEVLDAVCMEAAHGDDPGEAYWRKRVKEIWAEREQAKLEVGKPFAPLDFSMISEPEKR